MGRKSCMALVKIDRDRLYEHPRRGYTIMSREDQKNGKKSHWTELEIKGCIKNLSLELWTFTHLTSLLLSDNNLQVCGGECSMCIHIHVCMNETFSHVQHHLCASMCMQHSLHFCSTILSQLLFRIASTQGW